MSTAVLEPTVKRKRLFHSSGERYGDVMLTGKSYMNGRIKTVEYICDCGNSGWTSLYQLFVGHTKSCGCLAKKGPKPTHGLTKHPLFKVLDNMKSRCYNQKSNNYPNYGARGVIICDEWLNSFQNFYNWAISNGWEYGLTIERINNNGIYEPDNCMIATRKEQAENTRRSKKLSAFGEVKNISQWIKDERCKVTQNTIQYRMRVFGWDAEKSISTPSLFKKIK